MTFRDIEHSLPNGFHDASILGFSLNCLERTVALRISVYLAKGQRRIGNLNASAVEMFFVEPPDCTVPFNLDGKGINVSGDAALIGLDSSIECLFEKLPSGIDRYRFFLEDWNSFLYLAAHDAEFHWE
jgi:hypothetical protein